MKVISEEEEGKSTQSNKHIKANSSVSKSIIRVGFGLSAGVSRCDSKDVVADRPMAQTLCLFASGLSAARLIKIGTHSAWSWLWLLTMQRSRSKKFLSIV